MDTMDTDDEPQPLGSLLRAAWRGHFPPDDGGITVLPAPRHGLTTVVDLTAHGVVATARSADEVRAHVPAGFGAVVAPRFLLWLAGATGEIGSLDVVLVATGRGDAAPMPERDDLEEHHRVVHARSLRDHVRVMGDERGFVTIGTGLGGLTELSVEVAPDRRGSGLGRQLVRDALGAVAEGEPIVAEVAPGNARSLRAFLAAGFVPVGSAVHIVTAPDHDGSRPSTARGPSDDPAPA